MEFLNGIVEKLAPIHEKILDLTNPLTLTIEEYVPQLASFHNYLIYVLILAMIPLFGLLKKAVRRLTRVRLPRRSGPAMRMSPSPAPSTPPSSAPKSVVHGHALDYGAHGFTSQPMGSAAAFGTAQQPSVAGQGYGAQSFAPQPMGSAAAFGTAQQQPVAGQGYGAQGFAPQPMGSVAAFGTAQQPPVAGQGYGAQGFAPQPMGSAAAFGTAQQPPVAGQGYGAQGFAPQLLGSATAFGTAQQPPAAGQGYGAQGFASQPMDPATAFGTAQQPPAAGQGYGAQSFAPQQMDPAAAFGMPQQPPVAGQGYGAQSFAPQPEAPAFDAGEQQPTAAQADTSPKMGTPVFDFNSFAQQPAADQSYSAQPSVAPQPEAPAFDAGVQQPAAAQGDTSPKMEPPVFDFNSFAQQPAADQDYAAQPDAAPQPEAPAFDAGAQQPATAQGDTSPKMEPPVFDFNSFAQQPAADQDYAAQPDAAPQPEAPAFDAGAQQPAAAHEDAIPKMGTPLFDFDSFAQQSAVSPEHAVQSDVTPQRGSASGEPFTAHAAPFAPFQQAEAPVADVPHVAEDQPQAKKGKGSMASWKEPDALTAEERLARLYPNMESEFQNLYINIYADQELTTDFGDLRNSVSQRILQNQSPLPLFDPGQGNTRDLLLAHIANSALDVIKKLSENRQGDRPKFNLHEQELYKIYRCALYRLNESGLITEETVKRLMQEAHDLTATR